MMTTTPTINNLNSANWIADIPGFEGLTLKLTKFSIPNIRVEKTSISNVTEFVLQETGNHVEYDDLEFEFLVDENLWNYRRLHAWMRSNAKRGIADTTSVYVHVTDNAKRFQGVELEFLDAFPTELGELEFDPDGNTTDLTCKITFSFTGMDFVDETDVNAPWKPFK